MILCGTGHRPNKLGGYGSDVVDRLLILIEESLNRIKPDIVISGMAIGFDIALAQSSINLGISLVAAIPFVGQEKIWPVESQLLYQYLISQAHKVHVVCSGDYDPSKMKIRNKWMVDHSDEVLALYDGQSFGGTKHCLDYAIKKNKKIHNLWEDWLTLQAIVPGDNNC
jgi:uncharacterized phage-like protein YoqJ